MIFWRNWTPAEALPVLLLTQIHQWNRLHDEKIIQIKKIQKLFPKSYSGTSPIMKRFKAPGGD